MKKEELRIVYMGTPEFAVGSLRALVEGGYNVVGVVTMPDKPVGRHGSVLQASDVKQYAVSVGLPVLQPVRLKDESFLEELKALKADLQIVVAFRMLPEVVWNMPPLGTFNLHGSLLPQYRGAAPINWSIINGDTETGVTTFFLTHEIDTGKIIKQIKINVEDADNAGIVHDKLMNAGAKLAVETVDLLLNGQIEAIEQNTLYTDPEKLLPAPKIFKDTCRIDWTQPLKRIYDFIRGLSPYPAAWTELESIDGNTYTLKIYEAKKICDTHPFSVGTIRTDGKSYLNIAVQDGFLQLISVQLSGKKQMNINDFLNGFKQIENYKICILNAMNKEQLSIKSLITLAKQFCEQESKMPNSELFGVTDGKAVGTYIEHKFKNFLLSKYYLQVGSSTSGIDLPSPEINTDIKVTSIKQPQSSCSFKNAQQKIFGLGYNLLVFVYDKQDNATNKTALLDFVSCSFIEKERTADYQTTTALLQMIENKANTEDIFAYLNDRNIPADEITLMNMAETILQNPPKVGYLTISNALQWRLQYGRIVMLKEEITGIIKIIDKC